MEKDKLNKNNPLNSNPVAKSTLNSFNDKTNSSKPILQKNNLFNNSVKKTALSSLSKKSNNDKSQKPQEYQLNLSDRERFEALYVYGIRFYKSDRKKALAYLLESLKLNTEYIDAYYNIAVIYGELGEIDNAIKYYKEVLNRNPVHRNTLFNLGNEHLYLGNYELSIEYYERVCNSESEDYECLINLAFAYIYHKKDYSKALECYQKLNNVKQIDPEISYNIALCYELSGEEDKATSAYEKIILQYPENYQSLFNLGSIYNKTLRKHKAVKIFQRYLDIPDKPLSQYNNVQYAIRRMKEYKEEGLI